MKRYLVFAYGVYEPAGGVNDIIGHYDTMGRLVSVRRMFKEVQNP